MTTTPDTVYGLFLEAARTYRKPDALASKVGGAWRLISHDLMLERVRRIALGLYAHGVRRGDRVALLCESRPEWPLVDLGTLGCCAALVPIYATLTAEHVAHILGDSGAKICVVSNEAQLAKVLPLLGELPALERIVLVDALPEPPTDERVTTLAALEARGAELDASDPGLAERLAAEGTRDDLVTLIYTSGTTGKQKGVMLTHGNILANVEGTFDGDELFSREDVALSFLPQSHILERTAVYGFLRSGVAIYFAQSIDTVASDLKEVRPTVMTSVPRLFEKIYARITDVGLAAGGVKSAIFRQAMSAGDAYARATHAGERVGPLLGLRYDLARRLVYSKWKAGLGGRIRLFISGGAPLAPDIAFAFLAAGIPIYEGYGLTETSPVIAVNKPGKFRIGTVGKVLPNVDVRFDADGEILAKGPSIMQGYYNLDEATREAFTEDGYFRTGDIGALDADGYLKITDRKKDLLKTSGGKYIAPQPIENAIKSSNLVSQAVVLGDRRKFVAALVVPNFAALEPECAKLGVPTGDRHALVRDPRVVKLYEETVARLTPDLARYEAIKKVALLPDEMTIESGELTPTLKVKRRVVEERHKETIEAMYADEKGRASHG